MKDCKRVIYLQLLLLHLDGRQVQLCRELVRQRQFREFSGIENLLTFDKTHPIF